jgi:hypothetical protein
MGGNDPPPLSSAPGGIPFSSASAFKGTRNRTRPTSSVSSSSDVIHVRHTPPGPPVNNSFQALSNEDSIDDADMLDTLDQLNERINSPGINPLDPSRHAQPRPSLVPESFNFQPAFETMLQKMNAFAEDCKNTRKVVRDLSSALGTLVTKMADIEIQLADARREKIEILEDMKEIKKRLRNLENNAQPKPTAVNTSTYASVTSSNLPPAPNMTHKPKSTEPKTVKPLKAEYPRAAREIVATFQNAPLCDTSTNAADRALTAVNNAMVLSPLKKHVFFGARFSIMDNLILTTALHSSNEGLDEHLETIEKAVNYIGPATA